MPMNTLSIGHPIMLTTFSMTSSYRTTCRNVNSFSLLDENPLLCRSAWPESSREVRKRCLMASFARTPERAAPSIALRDELAVRDARWLEAVAVGSLASVEKVKSELAWCGAGASKRVRPRACLFAQRQEFELVIRALEIRQQLVGHRSVNGQSARPVRSR